MKLFDAGSNGLMRIRKNGNPSQVKLKLCGITQAETLVLARQLGFAATGLIFYKPSPRAVSLQWAKQILQDAAARYESTVNTSKDIAEDIAALIGVFVDHPYAFIEEAIVELNLDGIQLHGREPLALIEKIRLNFPNISIWKAFSLRSAATFVEAKKEYAPFFANHPIQSIKRKKKLEDALLLDSYHEKQKGGSGVEIPIDLLRPWLETEANSIIAGGIGIENIEAFLHLQPYAIDVNSKLEKAAGIKDNVALRKFIEVYKEFYRKTSYET